jgi:hypothetical protein
MFEGLKGLVTRIGHVAEAGGLWWGIGISVVLAVASLAVAGAVVVSWPPDHFSLAGRAGFWPHRPALVRVLGVVGKNLAGLVMLVVGLLMALPGVPGQGILTMIIGLTLVDFPGKLGLERRLIGRPFVLSRINSLRARFKRLPLEL